jgi:hypothetical protein
MLKSCDYLGFKPSQIAAAAFSLAVEYHYRQSQMAGVVVENNYDAMRMWEG